MCYTRTLLLASLAFFLHTATAHQVDADTNTPSGSPSTAPIEQVNSAGPDPEYNWQASPKGAVCGPFAACAALRRLGADASPQNYITAKYVGTCSGSTEGEILAVIKDAGFEGLTTTHLSTLDLRLIDLPFIALVRGQTGSSRYDHWVTVDFDEDRGEFALLDSGLPIYWLTPAEFMAKWSGAGIFVYPQGNNPRLFLYSIRLAALLLLLIIATSAALMSRRLSNHFRFASSHQSAITLCTIAAVSCTVVSVSVGDLSHVEAGVTSATGPHFSSPSEVDLEDATSRADNQDVLLIDARFRADFLTNGLPGAVNIPVDAHEQAVKEFMASTPKDTSIVVYCQSELCDFDTRVARQLQAIGFANVSVSRNGVREYLAAGH